MKTKTDGEDYGQIRPVSLRTSGRPLTYVLLFVTACTKMLMHTSASVCCRSIQALSGRVGRRQRGGGLGGTGRRCP